MFVENVLVNLSLPITYLDKFVKLDVLCNLYTRNGTGCDAVPPFKTRIQNLYKMGFVPKLGRNTL